MAADSYCLILSWQTKPSDLHHIGTLDSVLHFMHGQLLVGEVVVGAADITKQHISNKFMTTIALFLSSNNLFFKHYIPNCWHTGWAPEPKADSYFYIFLLKKKKKNHPSFHHHHLQQHHNEGWCISCRVDGKTLPCVNIPALQNTRVSAGKREGTNSWGHMWIKFFLFFIKMILFHCSHQTISRSNDCSALCIHSTVQMCAPLWL